MHAAEQVRRGQPRAEAHPTGISDHAMAKIVSTEAAFTTIFKYKLWGNEESISGPGSGLKYTENLRKELAKLIKDYAIGTIFDAPCGDFYWMKHVLREAPAIVMSAAISLSR